MRCTTRSGPAVSLLLVAAACGDGPIGPDRTDEQLHTVVFHRQDTGENLLLNSDGTDAGALDVPGSPALPIAVSGSGYTMAVVSGGVVALVRLDQPGSGVDTIMARPQVHSLASFSDDATLVGLVAYAPIRAVLVFDRGNRTVDTLAYGDMDAVLPPVFSPDNSEIAVITASPLSLFSTILFREDRSRRETNTIELSRFVTIPIFGWPRWTDEGLLMAFVRKGGARPDTLVSMVIEPTDPVEAIERFRAVLAPVSDERPALTFGDFSTYAYTDDGEALVLGANPGTGGTERHALYLVTRAAGRVRLLLDDPAQRPVFPNFIN